MTPTQDQIDRAHEWVVERHPDATNAEHETHLADALADIVELDRAADAADRAISPGSLAMLEAGIESAKTEPTVYLGSFARGAGDRHD